MHDVLEGFGGRALLGLIAVKLLFFGSVALHQFVHGLACVHYRRRVREFGFTFLHGFVPTFYVDVTDIFMASRRARVVTAVSGPLVHLVLGAVAFIIGAHAPVGSFTQAFATAAGIIQWQALAFSLYPFCFIEMDGYHVFVDLLGVPTLKHDALAYVKALLAGRARPRWKRLEMLWIACAPRASPGGAVSPAARAAAWASGASAASASWARARSASPASAASSTTAASATDACAPRPRAAPRSSTSPRRSRSD